MRTERPMMMGPNVHNAPLLVEISDPVANVGYTLDPQSKVAHRVTSAFTTLRVPEGGGFGVGASGSGGFRDSVIGPELATGVQTVRPPNQSDAPSAKATLSSTADGRARPEIIHENL